MIIIVESTAQKCSFPLRISSVNVTKSCVFMQFHAYLVTFNKETLNGKLHFLCSEVSCYFQLIFLQASDHKAQNFFGLTFTTLTFEVSYFDIQFFSGLQFCSFFKTRV